MSDKGETKHTDRVSGLKSAKKALLFSPGNSPRVRVATPDLAGGPPLPTASLFHHKKWSHHPPMQMFVLPMQMFVLKRVG